MELSHLQHSILSFQDNNKSCSVVFLCSRRCHLTIVLHYLLRVGVFAPLPLLTMALFHFPIPYVKVCLSLLTVRMEENLKPLLLPLPSSVFFLVW